MTDGDRAQPSDSGRSDPGEAWNPAYGWVTVCSVDDFVQRVQAIREGDTATEDSEKPQPATAIRVLHAFALKRPIDQLIESAAYFDYRDAVNVLATAALCRSVREAAELAVKQWDAERGGRPERATPLTEGIIHDVACQRTALDVAEFVAACSRADKPELVDKTLRAFVRPTSGRTNLDKALLYIALRDVTCGMEATMLLSETLHAFAEQESHGKSDADPAEFHDLAGALQQLSPSERILEEWVDQKLRQAEYVPRTRRLVARLIAGQPDGHDELLEHVGRRMLRYDLIEICSQLAKPFPRKCAAIRAHVASREEVQVLAEIVADWHRSEPLRRSTRDLLAEVVARGTGSGGGPRPVEELESLDTILRNIAAPPECRRLLWMAAASHVDGRSGTTVAALLGKVERPRDRHRTAQDIARRLTARVLGDSAGADLFVDYVKESRARSSGGADAVYLACKELADPDASDRSPKGAGEITAEIAARLYDAGLGRDGWDLLERCLENEQRVTPQDVAIVVTRLRHAGGMQREDRHFLLRATVGRWSDAHRRDQAVVELRRGGFEAEATEVIRSLR